MGAFSSYQAGRFVTLLSKPFNKWLEYKNGIIDENGELINKNSKKHQLDAFINLVRKMKIVLEKFFGKNQLVHSAISLMLIQEAPDLSEHQNEQINIALGECIATKFELETLKEIQEAMILAGARILKNDCDALDQPKKSMSEIFKEGLSYFNKGDKVKINLSSVGRYIDLNKLGGEDAGIIIRSDIDTYFIRFSNGNILRIKQNDVYSIGDVDSE